LFHGRGKPDRLKSARLSGEAKPRLKVFDYYRQSGRFSGTGLPSVSPTCRHFGIRRPKFYYRKKRFDRHNIPPLENCPAVTFETKPDLSIHGGRLRKSGRYAGSTIPARRGR
jgi:hypothetical protein